MKALFQTVDRLQDSLTFHRERQSVLAGNLANIDTPGYRSLDLQRPTGPGAAGVAPMAQTHEGHLQSPEAFAGVLRTFDDAGEAGGADGNGVSLERELAKVDANRVRYGTSSELASRRLALLRYAAGDGSGG